MTRETNRITEPSNLRTSSLQHIAAATRRDADRTANKQTMPFNQKKQKTRRPHGQVVRLSEGAGLPPRAAFKLSHINKEFNLISKQTRVVLDLCAAPGGWSQVAAKEAGAGCAVIAVDLLPIRPIPNVRTIVGDITWIGPMR